jgi:hypothetical protein
MKEKDALKPKSNQEVTPLQFGHLEIDQSLVIEWNDLSKENILDKLYKIANGIGTI